MLAPLPRSRRLLHFCQHPVPASGRWKCLLVEMLLAEAASVDPSHDCLAAVPRPLAWSADARLLRLPLSLIPFCAPLGCDLRRPRLHLECDFFGGKLSQRRVIFPGSWRQFLPVPRTGKKSQPADHCRQFVVENRRYCQRPRTG